VDDSVATVVLQSVIGIQLLVYYYLSLDNYVLELYLVNDWVDVSKYSFAQILRYCQKNILGISIRCLCIFFLKSSILNKVTIFRQALRACLYS